MASRAASKRKRKKIKRWGLVTVFLAILIFIGLIWGRMGGGDRLLAVIAAIAAGLLMASELGKQERRSKR
jgi:archaellum biogenesis protein FlaJ (TadC family)